ncbi:hypothetical protein HOY80DRAFT_1139420 [Tuber brumale]|nr:hypothetical protein HOY80DRAFT_1139420 [Tuber brumale]
MSCGYIESSRTMSLAARITFATGFERETEDARVRSGVRRLAEELGWTEELGEVWRSVGGGSDQEAEEEAESSEAAGLVRIESMGARVGRLTGEVERSLSVVDGWKGNVMKDLPTQETRIARIVEADLGGENGEASLVDQKELGGIAADQPAGSSEDRTNLDTAGRQSEHLAKKVGSAGGE